MAIFKRNLLIRHLLAVLPIIFIGTLFLYAVWPWLPAAGRSRGAPQVVVFYGFSILGEVMNNGVFPAFQREWMGQTGQRVEFVSSFSGSGTVTNQLIMGVPAQLALLSLELDALRLTDAGVIAAQSWRRLPHGGVVNRTPFVILVRPGNPKAIRDFEDLARPGIRVVHPDPLTSGGANWAIVAEYGAGARSNPSRPDAGYEMLLRIWRNVVAQAASARAARTQFENGFGDALITYEQEVLWDKARGRLRGEIVYPHSTIMSEHLLVVIDHHVRSGDRALIENLVSFLWADRAQRIFIEYGFRSADEALNRENPRLEKVEDPFYIQDFGGWQRAKREIVDAVWRDRVLKELGK